VFDKKTLSFPEIKQHQWYVNEMLAGRQRDRQTERQTDRETYRHNVVFNNTVKC